MARADAEGRVTHLVLDLDPPPDAPFSAVVAAVKTSGAKGLHVVVPVRDIAVDDTAAATCPLAARAERLDPTRAGGGSLFCCYSPRTRPGVPVSFPVPWDALPAPQELPQVLVVEGQGIPVPRVAAMHEGRRRARARRGG